MLWNPARFSFHMLKRKLNARGQVHKRQKYVPWLKSQWHQKGDQLLAASHEAAPSWWNKFDAQSFPDPHLKEEKNIKKIDGCFVPSGTFDSFAIHVSSRVLSHPQASALNNNNSFRIPHHQLPLNGGHGCNNPSRTAAAASTFAATGASVFRLGKIPNLESA